MQFINIIFEEENENEARKLTNDIYTIFEENFGKPKTAINTESDKYEEFISYKIWKQNDRSYTVNFSKFPSLKLAVVLQG